MSGNFALNAPIRAGRMYSPGIVLAPDQELAAHLAEKAVHRLARLARQREQALRVAEQEPTAPA